MSTARPLLGLLALAAAILIQSPMRPSEAYDVSSSGSVSEPSLCRTAKMAHVGMLFSLPGGSAGPSGYLRPHANEEAEHRLESRQPVWMSFAFLRERSETFLVKAPFFSPGDARSKRGFFWSDGQTNPAKSPSADIPAPPFRREASIAIRAGFGQGILRPPSR